MSYYPVKVILLGNSMTGKTTFVDKIIRKNMQIQSYKGTIGLDFGMYHKKIDKKNIRFNIWDTSGDHSFIPIIKNYINDCDIIILFYDISDKKSYDDIEMWYDLIKIHNINAPVYLIGNKNDKWRKKCINKAVASFYAENTNMMFDEISIFNDDNLDFIFINIYNRIRKTLIQHKDPALINKKNNYCNIS